MSEHKTLRFDGVKYYVPHGARAVTIDGEKHYLCVPVKGRGATRAVPACEVEGLQPSADARPPAETTETVASKGKGHVPYAHKAISRTSPRADSPFTPTRFERRWLLILASTLALLAALLGCR